MTTLLDLIQEWASLNATKILAGGMLPEPGEARWSELKEFYEFLMGQDGLCPQPAARYSVDEIRQTVSSRSRLRVRTDLEILVMKNAEAHTARVGNLSCGGVLLLSDSGYGVGTAALLNLPTVSRGMGIMPTEGAIVWNVDSGSSDGTFRYRVGVQFAGLGQKEEKILDDYIVDSLEMKLRSLSRDALTSSIFIERENLTV